MQIQLSGLHEIQPGQVLAATAIVSDGAGHPIPGAIVHLRVDSVANSGGHMHGDDTDPLRRGKLNNTDPELVASAPTGADGTLAFTYAAPLVAGTYTITASCDNIVCPQVGTNSLDVKIGGLSALPTISPAYALIGATPQHPDNHYLTSDAAAVANTLAIQWAVLYSPSIVIRYNDSSLVWGGKFDIENCTAVPTCAWKGAHSEHQLGIVMDVRANGAPDAIPRSKYSDFRALVKELGADPHYECDPAKSHRKPCVEHFHVRLLNRRGNGMDASHFRSEVTR